MSSRFYAFVYAGTRRPIFPPVEYSSTFLVYFIFQTSKETCMKSFKKKIRYAYGNNDIYTTFESF